MRFVLILLALVLPIAAHADGEDDHEKPPPVVVCAGEICGSVEAFADEIADDFATCAERYRTCRKVAKGASRCERKIAKALLREEFLECDGDLFCEELARKRAKAERLDIKRRLVEDVALCAGLCEG